MNAKEALKQYFGYDSFKAGQEEVVNSVLSGRDVLAVMPTGSGKSICYQVPAMLMDGITLVISPLISLMQDQVKALNDAGIHAGYINSSLTESQIAKVYSLTLDGRFKILYVAPERLESQGFLDFANRALVSMVAVDEAHCISQWGQDFRPSYLKIIGFINSLRKRPVVSAFTATATEEVKTDISCVLMLRDPALVTTGFDRENLYYVVETVRKKDAYVLDYVRKHPDDSGIVYCATRKNVDALFEQLRDAGIPVARYHAGMSTEERKQSQNDFIYDRSPLIIATNAFGMGIDKSNVRYVIHYNMPQSMENYYQEAGRAGRDGEPSQCILLFSAQDIMINKFLLERKDFTDIPEEDIEPIRQRDAKRLRVMENYCRAAGCLRNYILEYFGEKRNEPCGNCGNCQRKSVETDMAEEARKVCNCVYEARGRYGLNVILGTLVGANRARLRELGTVNYKSYGILKNRSEAELRLLISRMIAEGYLHQTEDQYSVLRLGNIEPLRSPDAHVLVRIYKDMDEGSRTYEGGGRRSTDSLTRAGFQLFEALRQLRTRIAKEEGMPPYIIFNDRSLIEMCLRMPLDRASLLRVAGVGEAKCEKYGKRFLDAIKEFLDRNPGAVTSIQVGDEHSDSYSDYYSDNHSNAYSGRKRNRIRGGEISEKSRKEPFYIKAEDVQKFEYRDSCIISEIRDELNRISSAENVKHLFGTDISRLLETMGYTKEQEIDGRQMPVRTDLGISRGIGTMEKVSKAGNPYTVLTYPPSVQKEIVEHYIKSGG